jgi:hypothetical protein
MQFQASEDYLISGSGATVSVALSLANGPVPGANLVLSGHMTCDKAFVPGDKILVDFLDFSDTVLFTREFPASESGTTAQITGLSTSVMGIVGGDVPAISLKYKTLEIRHSDGLSHTFEGSCHLLFWIGSLNPARISVDLLDPPYLHSWSPTFSSIGTAVFGSGNVSLAAGLFLGPVGGANTSGRFSSWMLTMSATGATPLTYLQTIRLKLYLDNGLTMLLTPQTIYLGANVGTFLFNTGCASTGRPSYLDILAVANTAGVATDIAAGTVSISCTLQPLNYERI